MVAIAVADAPMAAVDAQTAVVAAQTAVAAAPSLAARVSNAVLAPAAQGLTVVIREAGLVRRVARSSSPKC